LLRSRFGQTDAPHDSLIQFLRFFLYNSRINMKFLHLADIHLGCRRYNLDERVRDFFRAWRDCLKRYAIGEGVDFVIVAGDFFNSRRVEPQTMNHAVAGLNMLKEAQIPVVAIEGNHDQHDPLSQFSWLRSLSKWGYLHLLEPVHENGGCVLNQWNEATREGAYIDIKGARIFGSHWYGASTNAAINMLAEALKEARSVNLFNILMLHTDIEGYTNHQSLPAVAVSKLKELRELVDYVALGHRHKNFEIENWAFNPGSLEACSIDEYREIRGAYIVEVDEQKTVRARHVRQYAQRPFQRLTFDVSGKTSVEEVQNGVLDTVRREVNTYNVESDELQPIIEITLRGHLGFKNSLLELNRLRDEARALCGALHVLIRNQSVPIEYAVAAGLDENVSRAERERRIVEDLIARDTRFRDDAPAMASLVLETKRLALSDETPAAILETIEQELLKKNREGSGQNPEDLFIASPSHCSIE
jgi:exonuclease SbcD